MTDDERKHLNEQNRLSRRVEDLQRIVREGDPADRAAAQGELDKIRDELRAAQAGNERPSGAGKERQ